jgi:hypothetical protein
MIRESPSSTGNALHPPHARMPGFSQLGHSIMEIDGVGEKPREGERRKVEELESVARKEDSEINLNSEVWRADSHFRERKMTQSTT